MFKQAVFHREICGSALTLIVASPVVTGSPGPLTISATAVGAAHGFRRSLIYVCGLILGTTTVLLAVALGVVTILLSIPHGASALVAVSTIYIGYLAMRIATAPPLANRSDQVAAPAFAGFSCRGWRRVVTVRRGFPRLALRRSSLAPSRQDKHLQPI
jgi:threonine/homoserine/homoserine lactone efflux protein